MAMPYVAVLKDFKGSPKAGSKEHKEGWGGGDSVDPGAVWVKRQGF